MTDRKKMLMHRTYENPAEDEVIHIISTVVGTINPDQSNFLIGETQDGELRGLTCEELEEKWKEVSLSTWVARVIESREDDFSLHSRLLALTNQEVSRLSNMLQTKSEEPAQDHPQVQVCLKVNPTSEEALGRIAFYQDITDGLDGPIAISYASITNSMRLRHRLQNEPTNRKRKLKFLKIIPGSLKTRDELHNKFLSLREDTFSRWFQPDQSMLDYIDSLEGCQD